MSKSQMLINYVPGEECRVAIVEDGKLEELHVEKFAHASRVGNIYLGKVNNVEASIQAAFVDFGVGENGFLHVSDLHPRYFPGVTEDDSIEKVGHKTPRRERPAMQDALKRNNEILVQVLKEGVGTKGPTLTSYLSIPGRFLVMMPFMDNVGVSRKVEDEDQRRKMREILDQLELPEGFGFILRTAGMDRTKAELKRDLAYLMRLWKDMEQRLKTGSGRTRLLYSESDLLVRALRDMLTAETDEVIVDNPAAMQRAARFLKIVAPRSTCKLLHYGDKAPMFHSFGVEEQISLMHAREVPLPSGGRLVIDQTEAMVAIDVNSGRSRDARDSEENAFHTNLEAVDEICRQLRLRDMGGIVCNDLIDMRSPKARKDVETRFKERLKRDRAKTTIATISPFGILEMTRQRMRGSHETVHFADCPTCRGRGILQKPDSVAADALRDLAALLSHEQVKKVEMVVAPRVASELLSHKRQLLSRIERTMEKTVEVRVSETVPVDRVTVYAYGDEGDLELSKLTRPVKPKNLEEFVYAEAADTDEPLTWDEPPTAVDPEEPLDAESVESHPIELDEVPLDGEGHVDEVAGPTLADVGRRDRRGGRDRQGRSGRGGRDRGPARGDGPHRDGHRGGRGGSGMNDRGGRPPGGGPRPMAGPALPIDDTDEWGEAPVVPLPGAAPREIAPIPGPVGAAGPGMASGPGDGFGEGGEGGGRRRGRRRRGRGGRGGDRAMGPGLPGAIPLNAGPMGNGPTLSGPAGAADEWGDPIGGQPRDAEGDDEGSFEEDAPPASAFELTTDSPFGVPAGFGNDQGGGGAGLGGRRRGRRRRGRGGRGGDQGGPMPQGLPAPDRRPEGMDQGAEGNPARSGGRGTDRNGGGDRARFVRGSEPRPSPEGRGGRGPQSGGNLPPQDRSGGARPGPAPLPPMPPPAPKPAIQAGSPIRPVDSPVASMPPAAPANAGPAKPEGAKPKVQPRSLYGAVRRKLNPSELNKRPKPE